MKNLPWLEAKKVKLTLLRLSDYNSLRYPFFLLNCFPRSLPVAKRRASNQRLDVEVYAGFTSKMELGAHPNR